jgi:hypothetical protein
MPNAASREYMLKTGMIFSLSKKLHNTKPLGNDVWLIKYKGYRR